MNILILNYEYPPIGGGAGRVTSHQAKELSKKHNIYIVTAAWKNTAGVEREGNIEVHRLSSKRKKKHQSNVFEMLSWSYMALPYCELLIDTKHIDIIFAHFTIPGGDVAYRLHSKYRIPYVIMSHGHDIPWFFSRQMWFYHLLTYYKIRQICRNASRIFLLTPQLKISADRLVGGKFTHKNIVIPNACDSNMFKNVKDKQFDKLSIVFIGRLVSQKNPILFLKSLHLLDVENIEFKVTIIGDGPLYSRIKQMIRRYNIEHKVQLAGWQDLSFIIDKFSKTHLFVLPSRAEAMSMAVLEALYSGIFIITTPQADSYHLIENGKNGFVIENINAENLADAMTVYYEKHFWNKHIVEQSLIDKVRKVYNWQHVVSLYNDELELVLKETKNKNS